MYEYEPLRYVSLREVNEAINYFKPLRVVERVRVEDSLGRALAKRIISTVNIPDADISHSEGFAVKAPLSKPPIELNVGKEVSENTAVFVRTGAYLPSGANAVVPRENIEVRGSKVVIMEEVGVGQEVIPGGSDIKEGEVLFELGHEVRAQDIKLLKELGFSEVDVFKKPRVAVVPTGTEFIEGGKVETSSAFVASILRLYGTEPRVQDVVPDDLNLTKKALLNALRDHDIVATIGGASIGKKDFVWKALKEIGINSPAFRGIKVHPGRVTSLATVRGKPVVLLPGFIQSTFFGLVYVLLPLVRKLAGYSSIKSHYSLGTFKLGSDVSTPPKYKDFLKVRFVYRVAEEGGVKVLESISFMIRPLIEGIGFIEINPGLIKLRKGTNVRVFGVRGVFNFIT